MQVTFDPHDAEDRAAVRALLAATTARIALADRPDAGAPATDADRARALMIGGIAAAVMPSSTSVAVGSNGSGGQPGYGPEGVNPAAIFGGATAAGSAFLQERSGGPLTIAAGSTFFQGGPVGSGTTPPPAVPSTVGAIGSGGSGGASASEVSGSAGGAVVPLPPPVPAPSTAAAEASPIAPVISTPLPPGSAPTAPQPAPLAVAPSAPAAPTNGANERDVQGLPWDGRIHSAGKTKNADGTWRQRRGTPQVEIDRVLAELRGALGAPAATDWVAPPAPVPIPNGVPLPPGGTVAPPAADQGFAGLMTMLTPHIASGVLTGDEINGTMASLGVPTVVGLTARPDLVPAAKAAMSALLFSKGIVV